MNGRITSLASCLVLVVWGLWVEAKPLFILDMCLWTCMMISAYTRIERDFLKFAFGLTFFTFLMGREFLEQYSLHRIEKDFPEEINDHLAICLLIALISFWIPFTFFNRRKEISSENMSESESLTEPESMSEQVSMSESETYSMAVRKYAKLVFLLSMPFAFIVTIVKSAVVMVVGYINSYLVIPMLMESFPILYVFDKIGIMMSASFCIFSTAQPSKTEFYKLGKWFLLYSFLTVLEGARGTFLINILVFGAILAYMQCVEPNETWFPKRKCVRWALIGVPLIMIASVAISVARLGNDWKDLDVTEAMTDFVYQQGVTGLSTKRAYEYQSSIPEPVSGFYTLEFLHSGLPARLLGNKVYSGNTEEHALEGNSMKMALAYTTMGDGFLEGGGTGSSYIIETFYDFGYIGIAFGSICYAFLLSLVHRTSRENVFGRALSFIIIEDILWSTRAGFTDFLQHLLAPTILLVIAFIFLSARRRVLVVAE